MSSKMCSLKCVLVGDGAVGKTCMIQSFVSKTFQTEYIVRTDIKEQVNLMVGQNPVGMSLWDTQGQEDYDRLRVLNYPQTDIVLVCFSVVKPTTWANVPERWIPEVRHHCPNVPILLVGTQIDLRNDARILQELKDKRTEPITFEEAYAFARENCLVKYLECSARSQMNLLYVFEQATRAALYPELKPKKKFCSIF